MSQVASPVVHALHCEYRANPLGLDTPQPRLSWKLQPIPQRRGLAQSAYHVLVASSVANLNSDLGDLWDSGKVTSRESSFIPYAGTALNSAQRAFWKVRLWDDQGQASAWSETATFEMGLLHPSDWRAQWIGSDLVGGPHTTVPVPFLRKSFLLQNKPVATARLYATALGIYEFHLNGTRVGQDLYAPGWTEYTKRVQYQVYDVTALLQSEKNVAGAILGDGWYAGYLGNLRTRQYYGDRPRLLAQLVVTFADGTKQTIITDSTWKFTTAGPITSADFMMGEHYNALLEMPDWNKPGFNDAAWKNALEFKDPGIARVAMTGPTVQKQEELKPISIRRGTVGGYRPCWIIDLGQNMVGYVRLRIANPVAGKNITLRFAEVLEKGHAAGNLYTANLRTALQTDQYTMRGDPNGETFEPHFTFHGFRFVEIEGLEDQPVTEDITAVVVHSQMERTGSFECSDPLVNQLQRNIEWGQKGNFVELPTDCPQRDERLGWTGDAQAFVRTAAFNRDVAGFFDKWCGELRDAQKPDGATPCIAPNVERHQHPKVPGYEGGPAWSDAMTICPWTMYLCYGDRGLIQRYYESIATYVRYLRDHHSLNLIRSHPDMPKWQGFGDWLATDAGRDNVWGMTPKDLIGTAFLSHSAKLAANMARVLGREADAKEFAELSCKVAGRFVERFVTSEGLIAGNTQTAYVLALHFDLLPEHLRPTAIKELVRLIEAKGGHLSTGFVGTPYLLHVLSRFGYTLLAYMLLLNRTYPSWLYPVTQGATTIWERWDGWTEDRGFQDAGMNSFNHYAYGAVGDWLYQVVAGIEIDPAAPGYQHILLQPQILPSSGLTHAAATLETRYGTVRSAWKIDGPRLIWDVTVPPNAHATAHVPTFNAASVRESGQPVQGTVTPHGDGVILKLAPGQYRFESPLSP